MSTWYDMAMKQVADQTWMYQCCSWDLCSKRFHRFCVHKYMEGQAVHWDTYFGAHTHNKAIITAV